MSRYDKSLGLIMRPTGRPVVGGVRSASGMTSDPDVTASADVGGSAVGVVLMGM